MSIQYAQQGNFAALATNTQSFTVLPAPIVENLTASSYWVPQPTPITFSVALNSWSAGTQFVPGGPYETRPSTT